MILLIANTNEDYMGVPFDLNLNSTNEIRSLKYPMKFTYN
jgi:hypothetical protein